MRLSVGTAILVLVATVHAGPAVPQVFPVKPVRVLVGFPPGAGVDIAFRQIAPKMAESLGQQIVIDNRPGAGGNIAGELGAKAPADGYTLFGGGAPAAISMTLYSKPSYDLVKDFEAIALVASVPQLFVVHPSLPARSVKEFVAIAKSAREPLTYASTGSGSSPHLIAEMFKLYAKISMVHIPYKGTPQATTDLMSGQVTFMSANVLSMLPQVKAGRLRALAITSAKRSAIVPDIPAVAETYPGFEGGTWYALWAPAGTSREAIARLHAAVGHALQSPDVRDKLIAQGAEPLSGTAQDAAAYTRTEIAKWAKVVKASGARVD